MDHRNHIEVSVWEPAAPPPLPQMADRARLYRLAAAMVSLALHGIVLLTLLGNSHDAEVRTANGDSMTGRGPGSHVGPVELIQVAGLPSKPIDRAAFPLVSGPSLSSMQLITDARAFPASIDFVPIVLDSELPAVPSTPETDSSEALWKGTYNRQMKVRIERLWRRPRTPISDAALGNEASTAFVCEAEIEQDDRGNVLDVSLASCNGSVRWRRSLVLAIQHASPLPAPPDTSVFSQRVNLNFIAFNYADGVPGEEYEALGESQP